MFATPLLTLPSTLGISKHALLSNANDSIQNESIRSDGLSYYPISSIHIKNAQISQKSTSESESSNFQSSSEEIESDVENLINSKETIRDNSSLYKIDSFCTEKCAFPSKMPSNEDESEKKIDLMNPSARVECVYSTMPSLQKIDDESDGEETECYDTPAKISLIKENPQSGFIPSGIEYGESEYEQIIGPRLTHDGESEGEALCYGSQEQSACEAECKVIVRPMPNISHITALEHESFNFEVKNYESYEHLEPPSIEMYAKRRIEFKNTENQVKQNKYTENVLPNMNMLLTKHNDPSQTGRGIPLKCIEYAASQIKEASFKTLSNLYYILFGKADIGKNVASIAQAKENILNFQGFPFEMDSEEYWKKKIEFDNLHYEVVRELYFVLISTMKKTRHSHMTQLLEFLMKPSLSRDTPPSPEEPAVVPCINYVTLPAQYPKVLLKRLSDDEIQNATKPKKICTLKSKNFGSICNSRRNTLESFADKHMAGICNKQNFIHQEQLNPLKTPEDKHFEDICNKQNFIHQEQLSSLKTSVDKNIGGICKKPLIVPRGRGSPLKTFEDIVERVEKAPRITICKLHFLLHGVRGIADTNRQNILEFNGFRLIGEKLLQKKKEFLLKIPHKRFLQICNIFFSRYKGNSKDELIEKLLNFLVAPPHDLPRNKRIDMLPVASKQGTVVQSGLTEVKPTTFQHFPVKLKDFERIRINVESSSPEYLTSLSDVLFLKSCDSSEIHQNILEFTRIAGDEDSIEFQSRKILLYHMSFPVIKNIAQLLDIQDWQECRYKEDLARSILKFLVEMKLTVPEKLGNRRGDNFDDHSKKGPHILKVDSSYKMSPNNHTVFVPEVSCEKSRPSYEAFSSASTNSSERLFVGNDLSSHLVVKRISEASYSFSTASLPEPYIISDCNSDECIPLHEFAHHPSEKELVVKIREIISCHGLSITTGELLNKVYSCYPGMQLDYRINFIKSKALKVIKEMKNILRNR
ncbi:hypothetical protein NPIL_334141 [Nephila pilipes]|uniref:Uncharacterized protein n=1 Tax=Nephila pilipes TaxID=299642 RepID=A0A8X6MWH3_NEPPI|nr:hypothetical protein NPIL_334141 [Nephila pilipes]